VGGLAIQKEQLAAQYLQEIMDAFVSQKAALCCALEGCRSRSRNVDARRYIEQQRIAAMAANMKLVIGGDDDKVVSPGSECEWNIAPTNANFVHLSDPNCTIDWTVVCGD